MEKVRIKNDEKEKTKQNLHFFVNFGLHVFPFDWFSRLFFACVSHVLCFSICCSFLMFLFCFAFTFQKKMLLFFKDSSCLVNITFVASNQLTALPHSMATSAKRCREKASSVSWALVEVLCQGRGIGPPGPSLAGSRARSPSPRARPVPFE